MFVACEDNIVVTGRAKGKPFGNVISRMRGKNTNSVLNLPQINE